jgi:hypothetical protein
MFMVYRVSLVATINSTFDIKLTEVKLYLLRKPCVLHS